MCVHSFCRTKSATLSPTDVTTGRVPESIDDESNVHRNKPASDHRPLVATIAL
jgi:hypothetical protein